MEEQPDHILPKPEIAPETVSASSEAETVPGPVPTSSETKSSSEHTPISVESDASSESSPAALEAEGSSGHTPTSGELEAEPVPETVFTEGEIPSEHTPTSVEPEASLEPAQAPPEPEIVLERVPGYLSVREAARMMGVSERSVYGYVETGKLPGARIGNIIVVVADYVETYERKAPGRIRTTTPPWHMPPLKNLQFLTTIVARLRPGQSDLLEHRLYEIRVSKKHRLLGTAARYIARNEHDPDEVEIILIWRSVVMPPLDVRESALAAFYDDLADIVDWGTALRKEGRVLMHA